MTRIERLVLDYEARLERDFTRDGELKKMAISPNVPDNEVWFVPKHWIKGFNTVEEAREAVQNLAPVWECNQ
jgi:hypothetical protein